MRNLQEWPIDDPRRSEVTLRREYLASGFTDRGITTMLARGDLARVRRGAFVAGPVWRGLDEEGEHSVRARAVLKQARTPVVLSHASGLLEYDVPLWDVDLADVHVTRRDGRIGRREAGVHQHAGVVAPHDVVIRNGVPVMVPDRLALEIATLCDVEHALPVVCDLLRRDLTTQAALAARQSTMEFWPRSLGSEIVLRLADARIESIGEARTLKLLWEHHLPMPELQHVVRDGRGQIVGRVDFAWPELGVFLEFDGKVKYEKLLRPGERASDVVVREKKREQDICRITGWRCIRITWATSSERSAPPR